MLDLSDDDLSHAMKIGFVTCQDLEYFGGNILLTLVPTALENDCGYQRQATILEQDRYHLKLHQEYKLRWTENIILKMKRFFFYTFQLKKFQRNSQFRTDYL
jgi:hypothetical protein